MANVFRAGKCKNCNKITDKGEFVFNVYRGVGEGYFCKTCSVTISKVIEIEAKKKEFGLELPAKTQKQKNQELRARRQKIDSERQKERYNNDPEFRKHKLKIDSERQKERYNNDPEFRKHKLEKQKEYYHKKKELKNA